MLVTNLNEVRPISLSLTILMVCASVFCGAAQASENLNLNQALRLTLENNPELYQFKFTEAILKAQRQTSSLRPSLELGAEVENIAGSGVNEGLDSAETTVALSSVIELGGKRQARLALADSRFDQYTWQRQAATLDVLGALTTSFIEGLLTQANFELAEESLALSQSLLKTVKSKAAKGATSEAEVMRARASLVRAEIRLDSQRNQLERQKLMLAQFWGEAEASFERLDGDLFDYEQAGSFDQLYDRVKTSPAMEVFASETRMQEAKVALARSKGRSDLNWQAGVRRFEESGDTGFVVGFSVPLFAGKRNQGDLDAALAARDSAQSARKFALLRLRGDLFQAYSLRNQNIEAVRKIRDTAIPALTSALELTRRAYENGRYRYVELVAAQEELLAAKQSLIDTASTALISQALIEKLTGQALNQ